ncbi:MAG TPA: CHASE domain-containing protein [Anaeromyxobacteraceae bacterium]|nr:CHASE domain-containing protein [Anaeromyxobacteraceae bacterium]
MPMRWRSPLAPLRAGPAGWAVLAIGLASTAVTASYVARAVRLAQDARFQEVSARATDAVRERMDAYLATLRSARGLFDGGRPPTRSEFRSFVSSLELPRFYPGIQGIGWVEVVRAADVERHEAQVRADGLPDYRVWPREPPRDPLTAITYLEPPDWRNQRASGFDMASEPLRREAMERARDSGFPACSRLVELVQEAGAQRQAGFLIYLAVYARPAATADQRRDALLGWVYAPFRAGDLLRETLGGEVMAGVRLDVYDGEEARPEALLEGAPGAAPADARPREVRLAVAGRPWTLRFARGAGFEVGLERWLPLATAMLGLLVSLLLFNLTGREVRSRRQAVRAADRARLLADAGKLLASSLDERATLAQVALRAARTHADWCVILLIEPDGPIRLVGHADPSLAGDAAQALQGMRLDPEASFGAAAALRSGQPWLSHDVDAATWARLAAGPAQLMGLELARVRSVLTAPLQARGEDLGAITLVSCDPARRFGEADVDMVLDLARLAVAAIDTSRLYRRAQQAVKLRDEFLSIASHELRTPLTSLALQSDSLRATAARGDVPPAVARKVEVIRRNVDRLAQLISALLDITRIGAGRLELQLERVDLAQVVQDVAERFEDEARRGGSELRVAVAPGIVGRWDRLRIDQVLTNLVGNALKYGQGRPVEVRAAADGDRALLSVRDEGIGIPLEAQQRIFERFERAVSGRHYGGFGLGLWIVRRILEELGGSIRVESEPGRGATFTVALPLGELPRADRPREALRADAGRPQP